MLSESDSCPLRVTKKKTPSAEQVPPRAGGPSPAVCLHLLANYCRAELVASFSLDVWWLLEVKNRQERSRGKKAEQDSMLR